MTSTQRPLPNQTNPAPGSGDRTQACDAGLKRRGLVLAGLGAACLGAQRFALAGDAPQATAGSTPRDILATEQLRAEERSQLCSPDNASGVGLRGEYFGAESMRGDVLLVRIDGPVNFDASLDWPADRARQRPRSVRWSGWVKPSVAGTYRFHAADVPQARVTVAKRVMAGEGAAADAQVELSAGRFYPITVELAHLRSLKDVVRLEWTAPYGSRFVIPRALLYVPTDTVDKPAG
jgi:PA14 domain